MKLRIPSLRAAKTEDPMVTAPNASIFSIGPSTWIWAELLHDHLIAPPPIDILQPQLRGVYITAFPPPISQTSTLRFITPP